MVSFYAIAIVGALATLGNAHGCHQLNCYFNTCARNQGEALDNAGNIFSQITNFNDRFSLDRFQTSGGSACEVSVTSISGPQPVQTLVSEVPGSRYDGWINVWRVPKSLQPSGCTVRNSNVKCK